MSLLKAAKSKNWNEFERILQGGDIENINHINPLGETALKYTLCNEKWEFVQRMLELGADPNRYKFSGGSPLTIAIGHAAPLDIIKQLITTKNINMQAVFANSPLHFAVALGRWELVPVLVEAGADINLPSMYDFPGRLRHCPLHYSIHFQVPPDVIRVLISSENIRLKDVDNNTALHLAIIMKRWDLVLVLLEYDPDINGQDAVYKYSPLHAAVFYDAPDELVNSLISKENINLLDVNGCTPLHLVLNKSRWKLVPVLIQKGADVALLPPTLQPHSTKPAFLQLLAIRIIRDCLPNFLDATFDKLPLPGVILDHVKLRHMAEEVVEKGKKSRDILTIE